MEFLGVPNSLSTHLAPIIEESMLDHNSNNATIFLVQHPHDVGDGQLVIQIADSQFASFVNIFQIPTTSTSPVSLARSM
jgi:hypothetical protein